MDSSLNAPKQMSRREALALLAVSAASAHAPAASATQNHRGRMRAASPWVAYYGSALPSRSFASYQLAILDPHYAHSLGNSGAAVTLGYLSLGEFNTTSPFARLLRDRSMLTAENPNWPGSISVDLRHDAWRVFIVDDVIPRVLGGGVDGLFLDTLDSALHLEVINAERYQGMQAAALALVRDIRRAHPDIPIMMNRAYALLPRVNSEIDAVLTESLVTTYDFSEHVYKWVDGETRARHLALLRPAHEGARPVPIYSLDYWDPNDRAGIAAIYARERELGHTPYVATILLDQLMPEPSR